MKMEQIECSETPAYKIQTPGNYPEKTYNSLAYVSGCIHCPWKWTWGILAHHGDSPYHTGIWTCAPRWGGRQPICWVGGDVTQHAMHSNSHCQWWQHLYQVVRLNYGGSHSVCLCCLGIETSFICWLSVYNYNSIRAKQLQELMDFISFTWGNSVWRIQGCHRWIYRIMEGGKKNTFMGIVQNIHRED
jgi:hypothetical protein